MLFNKLKNVLTNKYEEENEKPPKGLTCRNF